MAKQRTKPGKDSFAWAPILPLIVGAGIYILLLALGERLLGDPDTYSHIALGRWIIEHRAVPSGDPFSHTMPNAHWVAFEWLSQVAFALAHKLGGWPGTIFLAASAIALAFALLTRFLLRELPPMPAFLIVLAAFVLASPHMLARPHALALPLMVLWVGALVRAVDDQRPPSWLLLPLMTLWANLHGSFTLGLAIIAPIAFDAVWNAKASARKSIALPWIYFALLALVAACLTPYGPELILVTYRTLALGEALSIISEWQPQDFSRPGAFEFIMLLAIGFALYRGLKLPPLRILMIFGLLHLALSQSRHADVFGLLAPLFLMRPLARELGSRAAARAEETPTQKTWLAAAAAVVLVIAASLFIARQNVSPAAGITPSQAIAGANLAKAGPVLNDYAFGGYLDFVGIPPFIDGRTELYGTAFTLRHHRALSLQDLPALLSLLEEYRINATLLTPATPAVAVLDRLPDWRRVYEDRVAIVHMRRQKIAP